VKGWLWADPTARETLEWENEMAQLDEAIDELNANIANLKAGVHTPDAEYNRRAQAGAQANDRNVPQSPAPPPPPPPPNP